ncbi:MAG: hypothetical protein AB1779_00360, partial [Candidatus Thermoplasmatota archaeon]
MGKMKKNNYARVPFALLAIFILIFTVFSGAYLSNISNKRITEKPYILYRNKQMQDTIQVETTMLKIYAERAVIKAMEENPCAELSMINEEAGKNFKKSLEPYFPKKDYDGYLKKDGFLINMSSPILSVSTLSYSYISPNIFGKIVNMEGPVYYRTMGSVEVNITDTQTFQKVRKIIELDRVVDGTQPFLFDQSAKLELDFYDDGLIEDIIRYYLESALDNGHFDDIDKLNEEIVNNAVETAIAFDSARVYRHTSNNILHNYLIKKGEIDVLDYWNYINFGSGKGDKTITIDFSMYDSPFEFKPLIGGSTSYKKYSVLHTWNKKKIDIERNKYIDKENNKKSTVFDINISGTVKFFTEEIGVYPKVRYDKSIALDIKLHFGAIKEFSWAPSNEPQYESEEEFINE